MSLFYAINCVFLLICRPFVGKLSDKYGITKVIFPSIAIFIVMLLLMPNVKSTGMLYFAAFLYAIGYGTAYPSSQALCMKVTPSQKRGAGTNTFYLCQDAGLFFGPMFAGFLRDKVGFETMYLISIIPLILTVAIVFIWSRRQDSGL